MNQFQVLENAIVPEELADKCGCCFQQLKSMQRTMIITEEFEKKFYDLIQYEFLSKSYTNIVCGLCYDKLMVFSDFKQEMERNQARLHESLVTLGVIETIKEECPDEYEDIQYENEEYLVDYEEDQSDKIFIEKVMYKNESDRQIMVQLPDDAKNQSKKSYVTGRQFECKYCSIVFATRYQQHKHMNKDHPNTKVLKEAVQFKCDWCDEPPFMNRKQYRNHLEEVHPEMKIFATDSPTIVCQICAKTLATNSLDAHMKRMHSTEYSYYCDMCPSKFKLKRDIIFHVKTHIQSEYRERYQCEYCENSYLGSWALKNHIVMVHTDIPNNFVCECGAAFKTQMRLNYHKRHIHESGQHPCLICNKMYNSPANLRLHNAQFHKTKDPCVVCGKLVAPGVFMRRHMQSHDPASFECDVPGCTKVFCGKISLAHHQASAHGMGEKVSCQHCGAVFSTKKVLGKHIARNHTITERVKCEVPECTHTAARKDYLINHIKTHKDLDDTEKNEYIDRVRAMKHLPW